MDSTTTTSATPGTTARVVAFQGERGAWGESAALAHFGGELPLAPQRAFHDVFDAVERGDASFGVVPIENSLAGSVHENYDLLLQHGQLTIVGEVNQPVRHRLLAMPGAQLAQVERCHSHPQALAQCMDFLREHGIEPVAAYNTAGAARDLAARGDLREAAIASGRAGELYGLEVLAGDIQARRDNTTRFFVVGPTASAAREGSKASVVYTTANVPGALHRSLGRFAELSLNLTKLESRPTRDTPWEYYFYVDFERADRKRMDGEFLDDVARRLHGVTQFVRVLGVYDRAG